jgi:hypothetical protein
VTRDIIILIIIIIVTIICVKCFVSTFVHDSSCLKHTDSFSVNYIAYCRRQYKRKVQVNLNNTINLTSGNFLTQINALCIRTCSITFICTYMNASTYMISLYMFVPYIHICVYTCTVAETSYSLVCLKMTIISEKWEMLWHNF